MTETEVGVVAALWRYPVKSMQGEALQAAELRWNGLSGDRQYGFYRVADGSRFPWHTGREMPELVRHAARYADPADPRKSALKVTMPDGTVLDVASEELRRRLSEGAGEEVRLMQVGRGAFDSMPVSVISTTTEAALDRAFGASLGTRRFRPNIVLRSESSERDWLGGTLVFGDRADSARLRLNRPIERCAFITVHPDTAAKDASVLRMVVREFNNEVGVYGATDAAGTIAVGDRVRLAR